MDKIHKVVIAGFIVQKDYMAEPDTWDWSNPLRWDDFITSPDIEITELVENTRGYRVVFSPSVEDTND